MTGKLRLTEQGRQDRKEGARVAEGKMTFSPGLLPLQAEEMEQDWTKMQCFCVASECLCES